MLDSLAVYLPEAQVNPDTLENIRPFITGEGFRGFLRTIRVIQKAEGVFLEGSLPRFLNGENARTPVRQSLREALGEIEAKSGLDLRAGFVYRLETAATLPVLEPPRNYLAAWGPLGRFKKDTFGDGQTVLYRTGARSFTGYDKGAETAPEPLPVPLEGRYALRLELKLKRALRRTIGRPMSPWELLEPEPYADAVERWKQFYLTIPKRREACIRMDGITTKQLERSLAALGLQALGFDRLYAIIRDGQASGAFDRTTASRMRDLVMRLGRDERLTNLEPLTSELDMKVRAVARFKR